MTTTRNADFETAKNAADRLMLSGSGQDSLFSVSSPSTGFRLKERKRSARQVHHSQILLAKKALVDAFSPEELYLLDAQQSEPYELLMVLRDTAPQESFSAVRAFAAVQDIGADLVVFPCPRSVFDEKKSCPGSQSYQAVHHGVHLYPA